MQVPGAGPDTRVVELRVHGILGTTGETLLDSVASVDVAGDGVGRIVRPADRLKRPVPGAMLTAGERTIPRIVEGYVWGRMTSGGLGKAAWALLFPFALANVAQWMLPPTRSGGPVARYLGIALRALLRLAALLLTMLFVAQLAVTSLDLVAAQCLRPTSECLSFVPGAIRASTVLRSVLALLPVGLVVLAMHRVSVVNWHVSGATADSTQFAHSEQTRAHAPVLPGANVVSDPDTPTLRALHVVAALSTVALVALGGPWHGTLWDPRWLLSVGLLAAAVLGTVAMDDPAGRDSRSAGRMLGLSLGRTERLVAMGVSALVLLLTAVIPGALTGPLPGSGDTVEIITVALLAVCVVVGILLVPSALLARSNWSYLPHDLRPWAGGWMAAPVLWLACLLGDGFGAGLALVVRQALGQQRLRLPDTYDDVTVYWGIGAVLLALMAAIGVPWLLIKRFRTERSDEAILEEVALLHAGRQQDQRRATRAWRWAGLQRRYSHHVLLVIAGILASSTGLSVSLHLLGLPRLGSLNRLGGIGVAALAALALGLLRVVYRAAKSRKTARYLGLLCDLTLFWPRESHPLVPPCYALKVIPELAARAREHLKDPNTRVVLVGHSQGSLLAAVATARVLESLPEEDRERVGLVTAGSQLQWAYPRAFPNAVPHDSLLDLAGSLSGRWRSLCRGTDPLGGAVTTWKRQIFDGKLIGVGFRAGGTEGPLAPASRGPTGALVLGGDHWLPDPQRGPFSFRRWVPGVLGHSEYSGDPEWDRAVTMAAGLEAPVRGSTLPLVATAAPPGVGRKARWETATPGGEGVSIVGPQHPLADVNDERPEDAPGSGRAGIGEYCEPGRPDRPEGAAEAGLARPEDVYLEQPGRQRRDDQRRPAETGGAAGPADEPDAEPQAQAPALAEVEAEPLTRRAPWERGTAVRSLEQG